MTFAADWAVVAVALTPVILTLVLVGAHALRRRQLDKHGVGPALAAMSASASPRRLAARSAIWVLAMTAAVAAYARPQVQGESSWRQRGIDLVIAIDYSKSMLARDVYPNRLGRVQEEVDAMLDALPSDRVGVVLFAGAATYFPLTHDHQAARDLLRGLTPLDIPPGSDLGEGILMARCVARPGMIDDPGCRGIAGRGRQRRADEARDPDIDAPASASATLADRARAIVLFTDGEDTEGRARAELERAVALGVTVFVVGVGTTTGELVPELDERGEVTGWKKGPDGKSFVTTRLDEDGLRALAEAAGGQDALFVLDPKRFRAGDLIQALERLERGDLDERLVRRAKDVYHWFLFPAFLLLVLEVCVRPRRRRMIYPSLEPA